MKPLELEYFYFNLRWDPCPSQIYFVGEGWKKYLRKAGELIIIPVQENNNVSFFLSAQYLVELGKWSAQSNVVKEEASVTAEQNRKQQEAVILVAAQSGLLETGVR